MKRAVACSLPLFGACLAIVASLSAMASSAQGLLLDGQTVATTHFHGTGPDKTDAIGPVNSVVGAGVELTNFGWPSPGSGLLRIDLSDRRIVITATADAPPLPRSRVMSRQASRATARRSSPRSTRFVQVAT
jgi:hypothetical protein